jgi:hypothetical protein
MLGSSAAWADCSPPQAPAIPDGSESSMQEMLKGKAAISQYQQENEQYRNCLSEKIESFELRLAAAQDKAAAANMQAEHDESLDAYNNAVTDEEALAEKFNQAIREYKEANAE